MNTRPFIAILLASACWNLAACEQRPAPAPTPSPAPTPTKAATQPDNTARNKVDRDSATKTPMDQSNSQSDIDITANIRRALMDDKALSTNAKNCKIITDKGLVTLRGPVATQAEKDSIAAKAKAVAGVVSVDNQLEITIP